MTADWIIRLVLFGTVHWILAAIMLQDIAARKKVFGSRKSAWVIIVLMLPCFGSLLYLAFHPQVLAPPDEDDGRDHHNRKG